MKKIPTIFKRDPCNLSKVLDIPHPACSWVFEGEGIATRKYDGTCCLIDKGILYKRREIKKNKSFPDNFRLVETDSITGKSVGWVPVDFETKENRWHVEAYSQDLVDGTYELLGPKIQGNPEASPKHILLNHADALEFPDVPRTLNGLFGWLKDRDIEGIVFHHPDGRMAKIKKRDFGLKR